MNSFQDELNQRLALIREQGLSRELRRVDSPQGTHINVGGRSLLNFSSNDYLGLANEPALKDAAKNAVDEFGAGSGASRLLCGSLAPHHELEESLAEFKGVEAALSFSSGYATALGAICALLGKEDVIVTDQLVHASIVDAARLSGATLRIFAHNDLNELADILKRADQSRNTSTLSTLRSRTAMEDGQHVHPPSRSDRDYGGRATRILIVTESVFSMDGDLAPLREIIELKEKHGAWLMLDEAHATGLYGERRRGLAEACALDDRIEIQMGTLGKALGTAGGYICGSRSLIDYLINRARTFIFSTAPVPASAAAATAAIKLVQAGEGEVRRSRLWQRVDSVKNALIKAGWMLPPVQSAIIPLVIGPESKALALANSLRGDGIFIPAIRYPSVSRGQARLRVTVSAAHSPEDIAALAAALRRTEQEIRPPSAVELLRRTGNAH